MLNDARDETSGTHDAKLPEPFVDFLTSHWRDDAVDVTPAPHAPLLAHRRARLSEAFQGDLLVVPTGNVRSRTFGAPYLFRGGSDFLWLVGDDDPDSVLVMHPTPTGHDAVLYARPRSDASSGAQYLDRVDGEIWHGRRWSLSEKSRLLGIETRPLEELSSAVASPVGVRRVLRGYDAVLDTDLLVRGDGFGAETDADLRLAEVLSVLRLPKDDWEIAQLQQAVDATVRGFEDVARRLPDDRAVPERVLEGIFGWRARVEGSGLGYSSIVGGGPRSTVLHWSRNEGLVEPGGVLLMDMGVENTHGYTADVTRVLPLSGTFSAVQREVYEIVHASRDAGLALARPGAVFRDIHQACMRVLAEGLHGLGLLPGSVDEAMDAETMHYRRWTLHGFGHMLGLDVHDCGRAGADTYRDGPLREGYALTMEPGLYFQPHDELVPADLRGIGVRIEDDLVVTADGHRVLSSGLPTRADEVETWLADQREAGPGTPSTRTPDDEPAASSRSGDRLDRGPQVGREHLRLLPCPEVAPTVGLAPVRDVREPASSPATGRPRHLPREHRAPRRDLDRRPDHPGSVRSEPPGHLGNALPVQPGRGDRGATEPVEAHVVQNLVAAQPARWCRRPRTRASRRSTLRARRASRRGRTRSSGAGCGALPSTPTRPGCARPDRPAPCARRR